MSTNVLEVQDLQTHLHLRRGVVKAVNQVSFSIAYGETLGLIGESGSGKTMTGLSLLGLLPRPAGRIIGGSIRLNGRELSQLDQATYAAQIRGKEIAMISQDPMTSLNPVFSIGSQVAAPIRRHRHDTDQTALALATEELHRVRVPSPALRISHFPHQFSGGMRQRVIAAMATACRPKLLIADEPTSALDVTIQVQLMDLLDQLQDESGVGLLFITHDLGVAASLCDRVAVMYAGSVVETAAVTDLYAAPAHPYTRGLLASVPRIGIKTERGRLFSIPGTPPDPLDLPMGCAFAPRCDLVKDRCHRESPPLINKGGREIACFEVQ